MFAQGGFHERRITVRLLAYWEKLRRGRTMPAEQDIDPEHIQDLWDNCFLIHIRDLGKEGYQYTYLGDEIKKAYQGDIASDDTSGMVSPNSRRLKACYSEIVRTSKPLVDEGEFKNLHGDIIKYRQCLLPLGEGGQVAAIFGGMRYRKYIVK